MYYEPRIAPLLPWPMFLRRLATHGGYAAVLISVSMLVGTIGFHFLALEAWIDAFLNTAMLLGGMGPVGEIRSTGGKLFAAAFSLYAGLVFLAAGALLLAPVLHRFLHKFHAEEALRNKKRI